MRVPPQECEEEEAAVRTDPPEETGEAAAAAESMSGSDGGSSDEESGDEEPEENPVKPVRLVRMLGSSWPERAGTVFFPYAKDAEKTRPTEGSAEVALGSSFRLNYRCAWERNCVKSAFQQAGFRRIRDGTEIAAQRKRQQALEKEEKEQLLRQKKKDSEQTFSLDGLVEAVGDLLGVGSSNGQHADEAAAASSSAGCSRVISPTRLAWSASWTKHPTAEIYAAQNRFQKVNHFPGSWCLGRKDRMLRLFNRAKRREPEAFDFCPEGYCLPAELATLEHRAAVDDLRGIWIVKPPASSCGRGIRLVPSRDIAQGQVFPKEKKLIAQKYLDAPFLAVNGRKFDLRVYVLLTSVDPLCVYIFDEGLVRFSTHPYTTRNLRSRYIHLTNYSVNKKSKHYVEADADTTPEGADDAFKWPLDALWDWLDTNGYSSTSVKHSIQQLVVKTLIAAEAEMTPAHLRCYGARKLGAGMVQPCFEVFGFDVFLDQALKPWLIEVNVSPSLMGGSKLDRRVKSRLMADVFHVVGFVPFDVDAVKKDRKKQQLLTTMGSQSSLRSSSGPDKKQPAASQIRRKSTPVAAAQPAWRGSGDLDAISLKNLRHEDWDLLMRHHDELRRVQTTGFTRIWPPEGTTASGSKRSEEQLRRSLVATLALFDRLRFSDSLLALSCLKSPPALFQHCPAGLPLDATTSSSSSSSSKLQQQQRPRATSSPRRPDAASSSSSFGPSSEDDDDDDDRTTQQQQQRRHTATPRHPNQTQRPRSASARSASARLVGMIAPRHASSQKTDSAPKKSAGKPPRAPRDTASSAARADLAAAGRARRSRQQRDSDRRYRIDTSWPHNVATLQSLFNAKQKQEPSDRKAEPRLPDATKPLVLLVPKPKHNSDRLPRVDSASSVQTRVGHSQVPPARILSRRSS